MLEAITRNWWVLLLRGICGLCFGLLAFVWPGLTLLTLVIMYGAYALLDGVTAVVLGIRSRGANESWWAMVLVGILSIGAGLIAFFWPAITATVLLIIIASWAIIRGVFEIFAAIRLRKVIDNEWLLASAGAASVLFGVLLVAWPAEGLLTLIWLIGAAALAWGILLIALALRLRGLGNRTHTGSAVPT